MNQLAPFVTAACAGHPQAAKLQSATIGEQSARVLLVSCLSQGTYTRGMVGDRPLLIPNQNLKLAQRTLHEVLLPLLPPPVGVHAIAQEITACLSDFSHFLRTDIEKCFPSVAKELALERVGEFLSTRGWSDSAHATLMAVAESLFPEHGLATGAPASPSVLEVLLRDFPKTHGDDKILRYVDDVLVLQKTANPDTLDVAARAIAPLGLALNPAKTRSGAIADGFAFLGRTFGNSHIKLSADTFAIDLNEFFPMRHWRPKFAVTTNPAAPTYDAAASGVVTFRLDNLVERVKKGSVEALCTLACLHQVPELREDLDHAAGLFDKNFARATHSRLYNAYLSQVKGPRENGGRVDAGAADKVLAGLAVSTYVQQMDAIAESCADLSALLRVDLGLAFADSATGTGAYHAAVKALFKAEYNLRVRDEKIPALAPPRPTGTVIGACVEL